jgi:phosphate starvation-inducible PhoH-like protein
LTQISAADQPPATPPPAGLGRAVTLQFGNNALLSQLLGDHDRHLMRIEQALGVRLACRGNRIAISGDPEQVETAQAALNTLYSRLERGQQLTGGDVDAAVRLSARGSDPRLPLADLPAIRTRRGAIQPRSPGQTAYMDMLSRHEMVFGVGPAGTGKTYLAVAQAVAMLQTGQVDRIILSRPAVEAGERLGFLPGDMKEKVDPYLRPLYDALYDMLPAEQVERRIASGEIEIAPIAFMRGRTLGDAFIILDEAQNTTPMQMKMCLTRFGQNSRMVVCGDPRQIDLPDIGKSGLADAVGRLEGVEGIATIRFSAADVVRHPIVGRIVDAYEGPDA